MHIFCYSTLGSCNEGQCQLAKCVFLVIQQICTLGSKSKGSFHLILIDTLTVLKDAAIVPCHLFKSILSTQNHRKLMMAKKTYCPLKFAILCIKQNDPRQTFCTVIYCCTVQNFVIKIIKSSTSSIQSKYTPLNRKTRVVFLKGELTASIQEYTERKKGLPQEETDENKHWIFCGLLTRMPQ